MHITWFSWKDISHPEAGGAERVSDELRKRLVRHGHTVTLITARYPGSKADEIVSGVRTLRAGGRYSVYCKARRVYKNLPAQDMVIDEMNTIPFLSALYRGDATPVLLTYQLARSVWFYQATFPISIIGYLAEPLYLRLVTRWYKLILTESESTKKDLLRYGFKASDVQIFRVGMATKRPTSLPAKKAGSMIIFLGALRPMKQPIDAIKAFEIARDKRPELTLVMAGNAEGTYAQKVVAYAKKSRHAEAIDILGRIDEAKKIQLLKEAQLILVTSIKEGWGLIVTEANSQGTPAIVYDTDGLRDSVLHNQTGYCVASGDTAAMGTALVDILANPGVYNHMRSNAFKHSEQFTFEQSYKDFMRKLPLG